MIIAIEENIRIALITLKKRISEKGNMLRHLLKHVLEEVRIAVSNGFKLLREEIYKVYPIEKYNGFIL